MEFLLSKFGLPDGTSVPAILVIELPFGSAFPLSFSPLLPCGLSFHSANAHDNQDHTNGICIWPANNRRNSVVGDLVLITGS
jgi:hypothetical protein